MITRIPHQSFAHSSQMPACALRSARSVALTAHRAVIHSRRLHFVYPGRSYLPLRGRTVEDAGPYIGFTKPSSFHVIARSEAESRNLRTEYPHSTRLVRSALRSTRLAALTAHRAVIHYRQLRFAYPRLRCAFDYCALAPGKRRLEDSLRSAARSG